MTWVILALFCAFFTGTNDMLSKLAMKEANEFIVGWSKLILTIPIFLVALFFFVEIPRLDPIFWRAMFFLLPLDLAAYILCLKAIRRSPISLTLPFLALTPLFSILFAYLVLGERVTREGTAGILCVAAGAYLLNADLLHLGILEPLKAVYKDVGTRYMIIVAFTYSITSSLGKLALLHSSATFFPIVYIPMLGLAMTPLALPHFRMETLSRAFSRRQILLYLLLAVSFVLAILFHFAAIAKANVAYMISIKRLSLLVGVVYGKFVFKEERTRGRFAAASLMLLGALLIVMAR